MRIVRSALVGACLLALTPSIGHAQDEKKFHVNIGGGPTFIASDLGEHFSTGWGPAIGLTVDMKSNLSFQFEYAYRWFSVKDDAPVFGATTFDANHQTHQLDFNLVAKFGPSDQKVRPYVVVGPGMYYRKVEITNYVGSGIICDPFWYVCGSYPITDVVGSRGGWDFGFNVGGGVLFNVSEEAQFFIESRYHYVAGPEVGPFTNPITGATTSKSTATGSYYPLTFGLRF